MACRGSTDERSMRYLRFRIIADRAEASHACSRRTGFFGTEKTERLTRCWRCGASGEEKRYAQCVKIVYRPSPRLAWDAAARRRVRTAVHVCALYLASRVESERHLRAVDSGRVSGRGSRSRDLRLRFWCPSVPVFSDC